MLEGVRIDNLILCASCYEKHHNIELYSDKINSIMWFEMIKCDFCGDQPTIWFTTNVNNFDASTHGCEGTENLKNDHIAPQ